MLSGDTAICGAAKVVPDAPLDKSDQFDQTSFDFIEK